ncbi:MAG: hypothetical protein AB8V25_01570, partial [Candidatus Midichloria sp.]
KVEECTKTLSIDLCLVCSIFHDTKHCFMIECSRNNIFQTYKFPLLIPVTNFNPYIDNQKDIA